MGAFKQFLKKLTCTDIARYMVIGINVLFMFMGLGVFIAGALLTTKGVDAVDGGAVGQTNTLLSQLNVQSVAIIIFSTGLAVLFISVFGFFGAWKQWRKCLIFYAASLFLIICIQLAMGAYLAELNTSTLDQQWYLSSPDARNAVQIYFTCCGWKTADDSIPYPDCVLPPPVTSCQTKANDFIDSIYLPVALISICFGCIELVSLIGSCGLIFTSKEIKDEFYDDPFRG